MKLSIASLAAALLALPLFAQAQDLSPRITGELDRPEVLTGLDVLERDGFSQLQGKTIGLITNHSGLTRDGRQNVDIMLEAGVKIGALFAPEHGIRGELDTHVSTAKDEKTGLTIYSLYGKDRKPNAEALEGLDTLVYDIQDIGARFYTYNATLGMTMEVAKERGMDYVVLDRPNPIRGDWFDGPIQDPDLVGGFTTFRSMPTAHGMTMGEMAKFYENHSGPLHDKPGIGLGDKLHIVEMENWTRDMYFDETGLPWVNPSPNMRSVDEELIYTMVAQTEANHALSVGRGTDRPFEYLGAPWLDGAAFTENLRKRNLPGIWPMQVTFIPSKTDISGRENYAYPHHGQVCNGVRFVVVDRHAVAPVESGIHMLAALKEVGGDQFMQNFDRLRGLVGAKWVLDAIREGQEPAEIAKKWRTSPEFQAFAKARAASLLYE